MNIAHPKSINTPGNRRQVPNSLGRKTFDVADASRPVLSSNDQINLGSLIQTLADFPETQAMLLNALAYRYLELSLLEKAEPLLEQSLSLRRDTPGIPAQDQIPSLINLAEVRSAQRRWEEAESLLQEALRLAQEDGGYRLRIQRNRAGLLADRQRYDDSERLYRDVLEALEPQGVDTAEVAWLRNNLAFTLQQQDGSSQEAEALYRENLQPHRRSAPELQRPVAATLVNLGALLQQRGETAEAEALLREGIDLQQQIHGQDPRTAKAQHNLAFLLHRQGRLEEAEGGYQDALGVLEGTAGQTTEHAGVLRNLASLQLQRDAVTGAEESILRALNLYSSQEGTPGWRIAVSNSILGGCRLAQGRLEEAAPLLEESFAALQANPAPDPSYTQEARERVEQLRRQQEQS